MQKLTIKESEWGMYQLRRTGNLGRLASGHLPTNNVTRCCLGFWTEALGVPISIIRGCTAPLFYWFQGSKAHEFDTLRPHFDELMKFNDLLPNDSFTYEAKKQRIEEIFLEAGIEVEFIP